MNRLRHFLNMKDVRNNLRVILIAAVLLQLIIAGQHIYTRRLLNNELERNAENDLRLKAVLTRGMLNSAESILHDFEWDILRNLHNPDSIVGAAYWLVKNHEHLKGSAMCFVPDYYPEKGRLFEPYAGRVGDSVVVRQIAGPDHDYTQMDFYRGTISGNLPHWSDPYIDTVGDSSLICTYSDPIYDGNQLVGIFCLDVSLDWLSDTLNARHAHPSSFDMLLTEDGKVIVRPPADHIKSHDVDQVVRMINDSTVRRSPTHTARSQAIDFESEADGADGYVYYANMRGKPHWQVVTVCYDDELFSRLNQMTINVSLLMLLSLLVMGYIIRHYRRNMLRLHESDIEQERLGSELRVASSIQQAMLPQSSDDIGARVDVEVHGMLRPAREVGGDLYEYFVRDEKLYFCIGDVSGKGVPSSLVMAVSQALFWAVASHTSLPAHILRTINQTASKNNDRNMFVTMFVGVLDLPTGRLRYCNAGHDAPVLISKGRPQWLDVKPNLPLGVLEGFDFEAQECMLMPDTTLLLYTDGVTEAMDASHIQYGRERLMECLTDCPQDACQMVERVAQSVSDFVDGADQSDDLTLLAVHYTPPTMHSTLDEHITLTNDVRQTPQLNAFVDDVSQRLQLDKSLNRQLKLALEEAVVNVMQYAYPMGTKGNIEVSALADDQELRFIIADSGKAFDPTQALRADTTLSVEERPIGGLGILLVRELMDSINYERIGGKNVLTLRKRLK